MSENIVIEGGVADIHVHFREPGQEHKEDFASGTASALAGGVTTEVDMPNNMPEPATSLTMIERKIHLARANTRNQLGFFFGAELREDGSDNTAEFAPVSDLTWGLKIYLNQTTGDYKISDPNAIEGFFAAWHEATQDKPWRSPIILHAEHEEGALENALAAVAATQHPTHIAHLSNKAEMELAIEAKKQGLPVTVGVCPHHLFMNEGHRQPDRLGAFAMMKPPLGSEVDRTFLWDNLEYVDIFESDHAPHTAGEKESETPPFGVPGVETLLPLLITAAKNPKFDLGIDDVIERAVHVPRRLLNIPVDSDTAVIVKPVAYEIDQEELHSRAGWSPYHGWLVTGKVDQVLVGGRTVYQDGEVLAEPGSGKVITPANDAVGES